MLVLSMPRSEVFNEDSFDQYMLLAESPVLPASLSLYKELQRLGFTIFILTGRSEPFRNATEANLQSAGYSNWERLILRYLITLLSLCFQILNIFHLCSKQFWFLCLMYVFFNRGPSDKSKKAVEYKSEKRKELEDAGYRIRGNSGDQWSDLLGYAIGQRSFKLPNPMYYIAWYFLYHCISP